MVFIDLGGQLGIHAGGREAVRIRVEIAGGRVVDHADAGGLFTRHAQAVANGAAAAAQRSTRLLLAKCAHAQIGTQRQRFCWRPRKNLDHATHGIRAVQRGGRTAQYFNAFNALQGHVFKGSSSQSGRADTDAVDQHNRLAGTGTA